MSGRIKGVAVALGVLTGLGGVAWWQLSGEEVAYRELKVERGDVGVAIHATGTVQPENRLEIKPPIAGRVEQVLVREGQRVRKGQILAWMSSTERAALVDAARAKGADELKRWEDLYRPTPVVAPINGTIILRSVESGQTFSNTEAILVMSDRLTVKAQVDETDISQIKLKQPAEIVLDAYADTRIPARVDQIAFEAKTVNNVTNYVVDVLPETTPEYMRSGMTANVTFVVDAREDVVIVPSEAIRLKNGRFSLLVKGAEEGKPVEREVEPGITDGRVTELRSGAKEGEVVLVAQARQRGSKARGTNPFSPMGSGRPRGGGGGGGGGGRGHP